MLNNEAREELARYLEALKIAVILKRPLQERTFRCLAPSNSTTTIPSRGSLQSPPRATSIAYDTSITYDEINPEDYVFPYPTTFHHITSLKELKFSYIMPFDNRPFILKGQLEDGRLVCIKFVRQYGRDVHIWCAERRLAPELLGFEKLHGGWIMVVMEFLDMPWKTLNEVTMDPEKVRNIRKNVLDSITQLHNNDMVHGDVRDKNILVDDANNISIIDFDWSGEQGKVLYPMDINPAPFLNRPQDVRLGVKILFEHDKYMVNQLLKH